MDRPIIWSPEKVHGTTFWLAELFKCVWNRLRGNRTLVTQNPSCCHALRGMCHGIPYPHRAVEYPTTRVVHLSEKNVLPKWSIALCISHNQDRTGQIGQNSTPLFCLSLLLTCLFVSRPSSHQSTKSVSCHLITDWWLVMDVRVSLKRSSSSYIGVDLKSSLPNNFYKSFKTILLDRINSRIQFLF